MKNVDNYILRKSIFFSLIKSLDLVQGRVLDVGCGGMPYRDYILENSRADNYRGLDIHSAIEYTGGRKPDLYWDGNTIPLGDNSVDSVICTEVLEHVFDPLLLIGEVRRVVKRGGHALFSVPFVWNLHEEPFDYYRYTPYALDKMFEVSSGKVEKRFSYGGWKNFFCQALGTYAVRGRRNGFWRFVIATLAYLLIKFRFEEPREIVDIKNVERGGISVGYFYVVKF